MYKYKLAIIVPFFNESSTIIEVLLSLKQLNLDNELVVINDGSNDIDINSIARIKKLSSLYIEIYKNKGKGNAIREAIPKIKSKYFIIQDGDLEYDPNDIISLYKEAEINNLKAIYGSRFLDKKNIYNINLFYFGNIFFTTLYNFLYNQKITDAHTCYKMYKTELFNDILLKTNRFEVCAEMNAKVSKLGIKIKEISISYKARNKKEGKKIRFKDALTTFYTYIRFLF
jgi:dolichol-phosphate mannosyltransferase